MQISSSLIWKLSPWTAVPVEFVDFSDFSNLERSGFIGAESYELGLYFLKETNEWIGEPIREDRRDLASTRSVVTARSQSGIWISGPIPKPIRARTCRSVNSRQTARVHVHARVYTRGLCLYTRNEWILWTRERGTNRLLTPVSGANLLTSPETT